MDIQQQHSQISRTINN